MEWISVTVTSDVACVELLEGKELLHIQTITETTFILKCVCDMVRTDYWKISCRSTQFYQILSFTAKIMHIRFSMVEQLQSRLAKIRWNSCLSSYFIRWLKKSQGKLCLPNWFTINIPTFHSRQQHFSLSGHL